MNGPFTLVGRSSSHFTRVARLFAHELGVSHAFEVVTDLRSLAPRDYADNPALRLPILKAGDDTWFGSLAICRALARATNPRPRIVWPEQLESPLLSNAQELTLQAMATEVELIMSQAPSGAEAPTAVFTDKRRASLTGSLRWLEQHIDDVLAALAARDLSYLEVTLFCLVEHLEFRQVLRTSSFSRLRAFCDVYGERAAARATPFEFDGPRPSG